MPRLSIVIPVLGDPQQLDDTLLSVLENRPNNCEILVVHNEPYRDPYNLSDEVRFVEAARGAGLVECINLGMSASRSPVTHVLTCGVEVCPDWAEAALRHFGDPGVASVAAVVLDREDRGHIFSAGLGYRPEGAHWRLGRKKRPDELAVSEPDLRGPDTLAAFYRKSAVELLGGFSASAGDALAGIDLALALRQAGLRCVLEPQCVARTGAAAMRGEPAFRRGRHAERLFWRWASSQGWPVSLAGHFALLAGQCVICLWRPSTVAELAGRACGAIQAMFAGRRAKAIETIPFDTPSVIPSPQLAVARLGDRQRSSRAA